MIGLFFLLTSSYAEVQNVPDFRCRIWNDNQDIPHVKVRDRKEAVACMGYLHGRDRAWQMDFMRRVAQGRVAEAYGSSWVRKDFLFRMLQIRERSEKIFKSLPRDERILFKAYAGGVNHAFQEKRKRPWLEDMGIEPETWTPAHSIALTLLQGFEQTYKGMLQDVDETIYQHENGETAPQLFSQNDVPWDRSILKSREYPKGQARASAGKLGTLPKPIKKPRANRDGKIPSPIFGEESGSNNWVVARWRTEKGNTLLANDPHLRLTTPMFWHWVHLDAGEDFDVIGAALPGVPVIVSGTNRYVSWGLTNSYMDAADIYLLDESELSESESHRPWIWVKLMGITVPYMFSSFEATQEGWPVVPDGLIPNVPEGKKLVLRWTGFELTGKDFSGLFHMMSSKTIQDFDGHLASVGVPSWNFVYAGVGGGIGFRTVGKVFAREKPRPFGFESLTLEQVRKQKVLTSAEMPHVTNPYRGFVATANNRQWPKDSKFNGGRVQAPSFRAFRIEELLRKQKKHTVQSFSNIQCDRQAVDARFLLPLMLRQVSADNRKKFEAELKLLKNWDFDAPLDCKACGIYRRWADILTESKGKRGGLTEPALYRKLLKPEELFIVTVNDSLSRAVKEADGRVWRDMHATEFAHMSKRTDWKPRGTLAAGGDRHSVNPGKADWVRIERDGELTGEGYYEHHSGASQRMVVEMTRPPTVWNTLPGPNRPLSLEENPPLDSKPWTQWRDCKLEKRHYPVDWTRVSARTVAF